MFSVVDSKGIQEAKNWIKNEYLDLRLSKKDYVKLGLILKSLKIEENK